MSTTYLITGANRGIGRGMLVTYLARPNNTVIAAVRDPSHATVKALDDLPKGSGSSLIIVKLDSSVPIDAAEAIKTIESKYQIKTLDVVIANAGISEDGFAQIGKLPIDVLDKHVKINAYAPLVLYQAALPLLENSRNPKFVALGSPLGSIGGMEQCPFPMGGYGASKAILHYLMRKIHFENEKVTIFPLDPGFVQTDMGNTGAKFLGMNEATTTIDDSVKGCIQQIDAATREKSSGHFVGFEGKEFPW